MVAASNRPALLPSVASVLLVALVGLAVPVSADHIQADATKGILFDHRGGNEWWVEVMLGARDASSVHKVEAMDDGGPWTPLTKRSWGAWATSFHIEPGHKVLFRATWPDGEVRTSCWFDHPSGVERCDTPPTSGFDASFSSVRGNEWWVQGNVLANGPIAKVDVRLHRGSWGEWMPMAKQSWGGWAASYHVVDGTIVQLRATSTDGQADLSSCRQWIPASGQDARIVTCPGGATFDAAFTGVKGNDWWVQVNVAANQPIAGVNVRYDCRSDWTPLHKYDWGWAASFYIPPGSKVDFQARNVAWASDASGGYTWPSATPTSGCPQGDWPRQGSTATYALDSGVCGAGNCEHNDARFVLRYDQGRWLGRCDAHDRATFVDGTTQEGGYSSDHVGLPPPWVTPRTAVGAEHRPDVLHAGYGQSSCSMSWTSSPVYVVSKGPTQVDLESRGALTMEAWYAESRNESDNLYTVHWDADTGLVLDVFSNPRRSQQGSFSMVLVDTDASIQ